MDYKDTYEDAVEPAASHARDKSIEVLYEALKKERLRRIRLSDPDPAIQFMAAPSYWSKGALKLGTKPGIPIKKPDWWSRPYNPGPSAKPAFLNERPSRGPSWPFKGSQGFGLSDPSKPIQFGNLKTAAGIAAIGAVGAITGLGIARIHQQKKWAESAKKNDILKISHNLYIDKHGAMFPDKHPHLKDKKITELETKLDDLIEFAVDFPDPKRILRLQRRLRESKIRADKSLVRRWHDIPFEQRRATVSDSKTWGEVQNKLGLPNKGFSSKLDDLVEFAGRIGFAGLKEVPRGKLALNEWPAEARPLIKKAWLQSGTRQPLKVANTNFGPGAGAGFENWTNKPAEYGNYLYPPANRPRAIKKYRNSLRHFASRLDDLIEFGPDPRPRNKLGEFTGNEEGGPDPNAMVRTYRTPVPPQQPSGPNPINVAETAAIGGAAGTATTLGVKGLIDKLKKVKIRR